MGEKRHRDENMFSNIFALTQSVSQLNYELSSYFKAAKKWDGFCLNIFNVWAYLAEKMLAGLAWLVMCVCSTSSLQ